MQRQFRLKHSADFARLRAEGRTWRHPLLTLSIAPNSLAGNRFGFVVSRHIGGAVVRNRTKRLMRQAVRQAAARLKPGFDVAFIARNEIVSQPYSAVSAAIEELFGRAKMWRER
ncbi:MAG TPA: ribonuclease P protein component [Aggregatilineales bacterium]|nr:ribonuclease P protein component [Aggregatilineales bacterium]